MSTLYLRFTILVYYVCDEGYDDSQLLLRVPTRDAVLHPVPKAMLVKRREDH
jgi:hypothetical protein